MLQRDETVLRGVFEVAVKHMPSFQVCFRARPQVPAFSSVIRGMQVFPKLNRADAQGSAADYLRFVSEMYIAVPRPNLHVMSRDCRRHRQRDLSLLGPSITLDQFSQKMWEVITANDFYDHHHWVPGPLGRRDPVFAQEARRQEDGFGSRQGRGDESLGSQRS